VSLAHRGVLFLDEAAEFRRDALQALRGPIEDGHVTLARARFSVTYPSRVQVVLATNPCPCGNAGSDGLACDCAPGRLAAYKERLSGPLLDRIDMHVEVPRAGKVELGAAGDGEASAAVRSRVVAARITQQNRLKRSKALTNAEIPVRSLQSLCNPDTAATRYLETLVEQTGMSMRSAHRILRVARTVADLAGRERVADGDVLEATKFRREIYG
jgi:magnesium chelatase family protein